ncbi:hypothetical protein NE865_07883 [Phthorimaea operculella]|nr:hypothetical protein NE865_07883 [Phthorimaea operculella]
MKKYSVIGNKKKVTMEQNYTRLKVVGNGCIVRVTSNHGDIEVIGNDCRVEVVDNYGTINLVGGNGIITIKKRWKGDNVQICGPGCHLMVDGKDKSAPTYEAQLSPLARILMTSSSQFSPS